MILALLKKIPWQLWVLTGVIFLGWLYGRYQYEQGEQKVQIAWNLSIERGKAILEDRKEQSGKVTVRVETKYIDRIKVVHEKGETIVKEIPKYIPVNLPDLPGGFRLLHDAAATSTLPREADLPGQPVAVTDVATTVTQNYTTCLKWHEELAGWEEWYQQQSLVWQSDQRK